MAQAKHIAIVGAGIGGLASATLLAREGHRVTLFDQFDRPRPVGSGLVIQPVGQAVLSQLGVLRAAVAQGRPVWRLLGHEATGGNRVLDVRYGAEGGPVFGLALHRAALFDALISALPSGVELRSGHRVETAAAGRLSFDGGGGDGPFDLVIDASGAGSRLSGIETRELPYGALWGWVNWHWAGLDPGVLHQVYRRADRMMGIMPIGHVPGQEGEKAAIFWSLPRDGYDRWLAEGREAWLEEAGELWPAFRRFAGRIGGMEEMTMARYAHGALEKPAGDRIVHIGDAAHQASPQLGQGANMALLDAWALAEALKRKPDLGDALALYVKARAVHTSLYQVMSALFTPQYQSDSRILPVLRDRLLFPVSLLPPVQAILSRVVRGDLLAPAGRLTPRGGLRAQGG